MPLYHRPPGKSLDSEQTYAQCPTARIPLTPENENMLVQYRVIDGIPKRTLINIALDKVRKLPPKKVKELARRYNRAK